MKVSMLMKFEPQNGTQMCNVCKKSKDLSEFSKTGKTVRTTCKSCRNIQAVNRSRTKLGLINRIYKDQKGNSKKRGHTPPEYSKEELYKWVLSQPNFEELYNNWVNNDYEKLLTPSVDRMNDLIGYSFNNIQLITWQDNNRKSHKDKLSGKDSRNLIEVYKYSLKGEYLCSYHSIAEAARQVNTSHTNIQRVLLGKAITAKGFCWSYNKQTSVDIPRNIPSGRTRPIVLLDDKGEIIERFPSLIETSKGLGVSKNTVCRLLNGTRTTYNFNLQYEEST